MDDDSGYQSFVRVTDKDGDDEFMELPREKDGTVLLSTIQAQFPDAIGLKYRSSSGAWRGIRAEDNVLEAPHGGWGDITYVVTQTDPSKKKSAESSTKRKKSKLLGDLIVFGLPFTCQNDDLKEYFEERCGDLDFHEVKLDRATKKSRGFGFIRFKSESAARDALKGEHEIEGRKLTVKLSEKKTIPIKLFVGRVPKSATREQVKDYFETWGEMTDVFVPHGRGFAFITYESEEDGRDCLREEHSFQGNTLKVTVAEPREHERGPPPPPSRGGGGGLPRDGAYGSSSYAGGWKSESSTQRGARDRSNERYDKYHNDRHDDRRSRGAAADRFDRHAGSSSFDRHHDERRRGRDAPLPPPAATTHAQKDIANELKTMLFTLLSSQQKR